MAGSFIPKATMTLIMLRNFTFLVILFTCLTSITDGQNRFTDKYGGPYFEYPYIVGGIDSINSLFRKKIEQEDVTISLKDTVIVSMLISYPGKVQFIVIQDSLNTQSILTEYLNAILQDITILYPDTTGGYPPSVWMNIPIY